ncbi:AraC family transcriptional regulator [Evansella caseinilytica]|uniref:AraC family transcriptional regulator n=1 Tax=Evansella caseinilytica TaxID=1503961 RepID=A0A1H3SXP8_9BACI|nr:AraC family transcriptional regulator [Evansella caseinilytica]SDZ42275.1 AraC family transcriptional regulator [Evansella caseinilytica]
MNVLKDMNNALEYIEENLEDDLDMAEIANIARCSEFHFKKMFSYLSGITLLEYIRRRRLTMAGFELKNPKMKVIDVAIKYGYHSPDAFARAFHQLHGINPSEVNEKGRSLKAFPRMTFQFTIKGGDAMDYRIEEKEAFNLVGIKERIPLVYKGENPAITEMVRQLTENVYVKLDSLANVEPYGVYHASFNFTDRENEENAQLDHLIGVATTKKDWHGLYGYNVSARTWAIVTVSDHAPETIQNTWGRIYSEWLPSSNYEVAEGPEILLFAESIDNKNSHQHTEIWIPVQKMKQS